MLLLIERAQKFSRELTGGFHFLLWRFLCRSKPWRGISLLPGLLVVPTKPTVTGYIFQNSQVVLPPPNPCWVLKPVSVSRMMCLVQQLSEEQPPPPPPPIYRVYGHLTPGPKVPISGHEVQGRIWHRPANPISWTCNFSQPQVSPSQYIQYFLLDASPGLASLLGFGGGGGNDAASFPQGGESLKVSGLFTGCFPFFLSFGGKAKCGKFKCFFSF